ncbi:MAG: gamma-glutamyl-gamma-aminobutyrate hydrolase family protein [Deltaproteobacteria bacterium]|nr:gamma-glutamyl-gamma-aminobutyrate hydrolase family protein [Deltaproteobacteria bacterium]
MSDILVIQHVESEGLGIISGMLREAGLEADIRRVFKQDPLPRSVEGYRGLICLGGPMGVYEEDAYPFIGAEIALIESALKAHRPMLGICLGAQLLARAAGAKVYKGGAKEIGWFRVRLTEAGRRAQLLAGFPDEYTVFQWHGDTFDVPANAVNLASSDLFANQFIKVGPAAYGIQFHLEVTEPMVGEWLKINAAEVAAVKSADPAIILKQTPFNIPSIHALGRAMIARFLRLTLI